MGLQDIRLPEAIILVLFVAIPMIYIGLVNPPMLGYTFVSFAIPAYMIAVLVSARREGEYNEP